MSDHPSPWLDSDESIALARALALADTVPEIAVQAVGLSQQAVKQSPKNARSRHAMSLASYWAGKYQDALASAQDLATSLNRGVFWTRPKTGWRRPR